MKKMILLLMLPLTVLMAKDFTMTKEGLFATATQSPAPSTKPESDNTYLEPVNLPECDANNPEVQFIKNKADWSKINSSSKRIFCVSPGDYLSAGYIKVTASGTPEKRRYLILNNGNDLHPGKLDPAQRANYKIKFISSSYWTIDRQSAVGTIGRGIDFKSGSTHNIVNRMFTGGGIGESVIIANQSNNNTIQNSRFTDQHTPTDMIAINILDWSVTKFVCKNTKIINNEFVDQNDAIQLSRAKKPGEAAGGERQAVNFEGTIIDGNLFYLSAGAKDMENAIDNKGGTDNASNPILITNNIMWGYNKSKGNGDTALVFHYNTQNTKISNNIIFDSTKGFSTGSSGDNPTYRKGMIDSELSNNLFYNCGTPSTEVLWIGTSENLNIHDNIIMNGASDYARFTNQTNNSVFNNNILVDTSSDYYIKYSDSTFKDSLSTTKTELRSLYTKDFTFTYDNFTNHPKTMVLENALKL